MLSRIKNILLISSIVCFWSNCFYLPNVHAEGERIRVAVLKNSDQFSLSIRGRFVCQDHQNKELLKGRKLRSQLVGVQRSGISIGPEVYATKHIICSSQKDMTISTINKKKRYREQIEILVQKNNKMLVLNVVDIEHYVRGVLYHEVSHRWPIEALKAQAVAARTYALYQVQKNKDNDFDLTSDIYSQVYGGRSAERYRTNLAVRRTKNEILTYKGNIFPSYFHSNCGGFTEDVSELWEEDLPPLKGVHCPFCAFQPHYNWTRNYRLKDFQDALNEEGYNLGLIKKIEVIEKNKSGRNAMLRITTRDGKSVDIPGKKFRDIIGPNKIKSNKYGIAMKGYYVDLIGHGWGHGVGMCQWGAYSMSRQRNKYGEILKYYYPGTEIQDYL